MFPSQKLIVTVSLHKKLSRSYSFFPIFLSWISLVSLSFQEASEVLQNNNHHKHESGHRGEAHGQNHPRRSVNTDHNVTHSESSSTLELKPEHFFIPVGGVIHLFPRYGYFHLSMKVVTKAERHNSSLHRSSSSWQPKNESWMFLEPVNNVIDSSTLQIEKSSISPSSTNQSLPFHNVFHIDLCEDMRELMEAYFKNFTIEGLDKTWQAFSGGWRVPTIAKYFGMDEAYAEGDYRYVLVKVLLVRGSGVGVPLKNVTPSDVYNPNFLRYVPDNDLSTYEFFKVVGTHYIHAYIVGNALYQVLVYHPVHFGEVKKDLFYDGVHNQKSATIMDRSPSILTKWVRHLGKVFLLNSSPSVLDSVRNALLMHTPYIGLVPSLFKLHNNSALVQKMEELLADQPNGVLGIDLRGIQFLFKNPIQRAGFSKALKHKMQLWEINFQY